MNALWGPRMEESDTARQARGGIPTPRASAAAAAAAASATYCFCLQEQADGSIRPPAPDRSGQNGSVPLPERGEARCGMQPAGHLGWCQRSKHERHRHRIASAPGLAWPGRYHDVGSEAHRSRCSQSRGACLDSTDDPAAVAVMANACNRNHQTPLCFVPSRRSASCCLPVQCHVLGTGQVPGLARPPVNCHGTAGVIVH